MMPVSLHTLNAGNQVQLRARELFLRLMADHCDFISACEARAAFVSEHTFCAACDKVKHRSAFYHSWHGTEFPCRECRSRLHAARQLKKRNDARARAE